MKTGRVRKKKTQSEPEAQPQPQPQPEPQPKPKPKPQSRPRAKKAAPRPASSQPAGKKPLPIPLLVGLGLVLLVCVVVFVILMAFKPGPEEWVEATRANGAWTTTVIVHGPQVIVDERWESDCTGAANASVRMGSCLMKETEKYQDKVVDDYEEFAYTIYYEETWNTVREARGTEFVVTSLGRDDWWQNDLHYVLEEELDKSSCQYTNYTLWVDDPQDKSHETEVYLAECEVWDHVVVYERQYEQKPWCQCDVTTLVEIGRQSEQGTGLDVTWPSPSLPAGGRTEQAFQGQVILMGDDYSYTTTTDDIARYQDLMMNPYYIGLRDGEPVTARKNPPQ